MNQQAEMNKVSNLLDIEILPEGFLRDYVTLVHPLTEAPIQFHIANALLLVATCCARNVYLPFGATNVYLNLYILIVSRSGIGRKTTALAPTYRILNQIAPQSILGTQMSLEGFYESFRECPNKIGIYSEFKSLMENSQRKYGQGLITEITNLWDCPPCLKLNLKSVPPEERYIYNPTLSIIGATTLEWLELKELDITGGFFGRFLPLFASDKIEKLIPIPPRLDEEKLLGLSRWLQNISGIKGEFHLTKEAEDAVISVYQDLTEKYNKLLNKDILSSFWTRIQSHILKLSMIFEISKREYSLEIGIDEVRRAVNFMEVIKGYYIDLLQRVAFNEDMRFENRILEILKGKGKGGLSRSELLRRLNLSAKRFGELIHTLKEKEFISEKITETNTKHKTIYVLNEPEEEQPCSNGLEELEAKRIAAAIHFFGEDYLKKK